ncbi:ABC-2 type transport system permease protein [Haloactinopolyspora alba]|uniref:Transport permease protein n=2 Tax=Haloactinopolyspora alba TaxID=648780 RepID=A0A2P8DJX3_9ACTN|nr:ABC transporter permease [Haloactinopolyspora alba]PSK97520.1 ABC-2 type transport system permease protein [Haloactinopolyspora alba]
MSLRITLATAARVLAQLRHDPRTIVMMLAVPSLLISLLWWVYDGGRLFDVVGPALLAIFPFLVMFLVTSIATLRERTSGTLERLLAMPTGKLDFLLGYAVAFGSVALVQAGATAAVAVGLLDMQTAGPAWILVVVAVFDALLGVALGLFVSAFASTEFQVVQFMPALILPQFLLCGLLVPRDELPDVLGAVSDVLPLSYAVDAMRDVQAATDPAVAGDVLVVVGFSVALLALGAATLRRRTP